MPSVKAPWILIFMKKTVSPPDGRTAESAQPVAQRFAEVTALLKACIGEVYHTEVTQEDLADSFHAFHWLHTRVLTVSQQKHAKRAGLTLVECLILRRPGFVRSHMTPAHLPPEGFRSEWNDR